ncbi:MAG: hypothetical protein ACUVQ8_03425 [Nitrososphaeria archaeon]
MAWGKRRLTVYGLSAEGYNMALRFSEKGFDIMIIDERLNSAMMFHRRDFSRNRTVDEFFEEEALTGITSFQEAISNSEILLFCPKIRCDITEIQRQYERSLKEIAPILPKRSVLVFWAPLGQNGQSEVVKIIQEHVNLRDNEYGIIFLPPFFDDKTNVAGTFGRIEGSLEVFSDVIGKQIYPSNIDEAEKVFFSKILEKFSYYTSQMITFSGAKAMTQDNLYYDDLYANYTDLNMIYNTTRRGTQLKSFSNTLIRMVDSYPKILLNYVKELTKECNVRPSRARIILLWSKSNYHVRQDVERSFSKLTSLLQDIFVDVQPLSLRELLRRKLIMTSTARNPSFIIACSKRDFEEVKGHVEGKNQAITVIKATLPPSRLT